MESDLQKFENFDISQDAHLILTSKFLGADKLLEREDHFKIDPYKVMEGPYGEHRFLALESLSLEPQFYLIGQEIWDPTNWTKYLIYKCKKTFRETLPIASTNQKYIAHEDTILVSVAERLYSLKNKIDLSDEYNEEIASDISRFTLAVNWPEWANDDWLFDAFQSTKSTFLGFDIK